jgi:peptide/nickel transport system substrate-binding protein
VKLCVAGRRSIAVLTCCAVLGGCSSDRSRTGIVVLIDSPPDSLDNRLALTTNGQRVAQLIAPGLVTFDDRSQPEPDLAREYRMVDPKTVEFTLRDHLTFHDGTPLTAEDVKATYEGLMDPDLGSPKASKLEPVERIEVLSPSTVRFRLKRPYAPILAELSISVVPRARAFGRAAHEQDRAPIGAGPFRFAEQPDEEHLVLLPFDGYYGGKPRIRRLLIRTVGDQTTRVLELLKGRADLVVGAISPSVFPALRRAVRGDLRPNEQRLRILWEPGSAYAYLGLNSRSGPLADVRVRRAICHAVDVQPILEAKFHGVAEQATGMLPRRHWAYAETPGCRRDLALATKLLGEAGYLTDHVKLDKPRLHLTLKTSTDRLRKSIALVLQEQLAQAGIDVEVRALEFGTFFNDVRKGNFEMFSLMWSQVIEPDLLRWAFSSTNIPGPNNAFTGLNRTGYRNLRLDEVLDRATRVEGEERIPLYAEALGLIDADLPYVPLWHESSPAVVSSRLQDFEPSPHGFLSPLARAREAVP